MSENEATPQDDALPVFPSHLASSIKRRRIREADDSVFDDEEEVELLLNLLFEEPEVETYVFHEHGKPLNARLLAKAHTGALLIEETQNHWYRHPRSQRSFTRITRDPPQFDWQAEVVGKGPCFWRCALRLTEAERRKREIAQQTTALTAALTPPDPEGRWAKLKRHWDRNQLVYGGIGLVLAIVGLVVGIAPLMG
jgi:hypothetical protein